MYLKNDIFGMIKFMQLTISNTQGNEIRQVLPYSDCQHNFECGCFIFTGTPAGKN
jgi:hypothetical protein